MKEQEPKKQKESVGEVVKRKALESRAAKAAIRRFQKIIRGV